MQAKVISDRDRAIIRQLAMKQQEYAELPIMNMRRQLWYQLNDCEASMPLITFDSVSCLDELLPPLMCQSEPARDLERQLRINLIHHEMIDDDRVVDGRFSIPWSLEFNLFGLGIDKEYSADASGRKIGHRFLHPLADVQCDKRKLQATTYAVDIDGTLRYKSFVQEILGDLLDVVICPGSLAVYLARDLVHLMGMEAMLYGLVDEPDDFHEILARMIQDYTAYFRWLESSHLLMLNTGNDAIGKGTFGFSRKGARSDADSGSNARLSDLWVCMDAQETISISPDMYGDFFFAGYQALAALFGHVYYGCCEPVHPIWDKYISMLPNLRKVAISPWCDERYMGQALAGKNIVFHRKPSPNLFSDGLYLDRDAFEKSIKHSLECARGCFLELTFRDVITLQGNRDKPRTAVAWARALITDHWQP